MSQKTVPIFNLLQEASKAALHLRAAKHPLRAKVMRVLHESETGELTVSDLMRRLRLDQATLSQQLGILRRAGMVKTRREGKFIFYSLHHERLEKVYATCLLLNSRVGA